MKTRLWILAGLAAVTMLAVAMAPALSTAADASKGYDPTKAGGYRAEEVKKMMAALPTEAFAKPAKARKLLVYTESKGFYHDSIPLAATTFKAMGDKLGTWETTFCDDVTIFDDAAKLAAFDGIFMDNTVGEHPNSEAGKKNFIEYVKSGKGLMGCHAAADCNHPWAEYQEMLGGEFAGHPWGKVSVKNEDPQNPLMSMFGGKGFVISEEIYTFKPLTKDRQQGYSRDRAHVLLSVDMDNSKLGNTTRQDGDYALAWIKTYGDGRVFYCAFAHAHDHFWNPTLLKFYLAGIQYALGDLKADATPSAKVTTKPVAGPDINTQTINPK
jgi:type 1 glutamine amidotransferase